MTQSKRAIPDHPIHDFIAKRWSPYAFSDRAVSKEDLLRLFEAARWAPSSYNEQPWSYIVATQDNKEEFERLHSCLVEGNQPWTKIVPVLAIGLTTLNFKRNGKPNEAAVHDLGIASATLTFEATARGLHVHQMIGIVPERVRELYGVPMDVAPKTGIAIGYLGDSNALPDPYRERDLAERTRKPLAEFVFGGKWGEAAGVVR
jgi:nitroreductase